MPKRLFYAALTLLGLCLVPVPTLAQCTLPHTIANGQPADASKVMANFNALISCITPGGSANSVQYNAGGTLGGVGPLTNGQLVIGSSGNPPQAQGLAAGSGISITGGQGTATIAATALTGANGLYRQVMSATPTAANTGLSTWFNQGGATTADTAVGMVIDAPSSGGVANIAGRIRAAPTPPYTINALVAATRNSPNWSSIGLGWYDGTAKLHAVHYVLFNAAAPAFQVMRWSSPTTGSSEFNSGLNYFSQPIWLQLKDDGTNVTFAFSQDGANFVTLVTTTKAAGYLGASGYTNLVFYVNPQGARTIGTLLSWSQN